MPALFMVNVAVAEEELLVELLELLLPDLLFLFLLEPLFAVAVDEVGADDVVADEVGKNSSRDGHSSNSFTVDFK